MVASVERNVHEVELDIKRRMRELWEEEVARRGDTLDNADVPTAMRCLFVEAHADEAQELFAALSQSLARELHWEMLNASRRTAMQTPATLTPSPQIPAIDAISTPLARQPLNLPSPKPILPTIRTELIQRAERRIQTAVDGWYESVDGKSLNIRFLENADIDVVTHRDTLRMLAAQMHREVLRGLKGEGEGPVGQRLSDDEIMTIKDRRRREVRTSYVLRGEIQEEEDVNIGS